MIVRQALKSVAGVRVFVGSRRALATVPHPDLTLPEPAPIDSAVFNASQLVDASSPPPLYCPSDFQILPNFVSPYEEQMLFEEISRPLKRLRYSSGHWDKAIEDYREMFRSQWTTSVAQQVVNKVYTFSTCPQREKFFLMLIACSLLGNR
eukprot:m.66597 g.66597  ORF g.66597 m.66597 type:complete len:150 (-) comp19738_c0_seq3:394-843(-)